MSYLRIDADWSDELVAAFRQRAGLVESQVHFVDLRVRRSDYDPADVFMVGPWREKDAFCRCTRISARGVPHDRLAPSSRRAVALQRLEKWHTYQVVGE